MTLDSVPDAAREPDTGLLVIHPTGLHPRLLDPDAVSAIRRLQARGYEAYLVGGCVRDLLLGQIPKDFDIATSARPQSVKRTFPRNCRIIGRRFKLAHLHYEGNTKILEVSTFRRAPDQSDDGDDEDLLITRDNEFGTVEEDALRRDFTINSLFYDPIRDEILDHAGGLADVERRVIRTIGDPDIRFREDPVRIMRAIKFAGRLGLDIESGTWQAMRDTAPDLKRAAPPRMLEELLRLLRGGHALDAFLRLRDLDALRVVLPTIHDFLESADREARIRFWRTLEALDGKATMARRSGRRWPPENGVLLAALFAEPLRHHASHARRRSPTGLAEELVAPFANDFRLPKRDAGCLKRICSVQHRFVEPHDARRFRPESFRQDPYFPEALQLFELTAAAAGLDADSVTTWSEMLPTPTDEADVDAEWVAAVLGDEPTDDDRGGSRGGDRGGESERDRKRRRRKRKSGRRDDDARPEPRAAEEPKAARRKDRDKDKKGKKKARSKPSRGDERKARIETLEPEEIDTSVFDVELDPKRVASFGSIVEGQTKRRRHHVPTPEEDDYRPPKLGDDSGLPPPPRPHGGGLFDDI